MYLSKSIHLIYTYFIKLVCIDVFRILANLKPTKKRTNKILKDSIYT